jgi:hypothetical protein
MKVKTIALVFSICTFAHSEELPTQSDSQTARVVILSPKALALFGQNGYCGSMEEYDQANTTGILIPSNKRLWIRLRSTGCVGDFSFIPQSSARYALQVTSCSVGLYRFESGGPPIPQLLKKEEQLLCLLPWNHKVPDESSESNTPR